MTNLVIKPRIALNDLYCWRCEDIGLEVPTIQKGENFKVIYKDGKLMGTCCMDCFERLEREINNSQFP